MIKQELTLSIRKYNCEYCGEVNDRDVNAEKNILKQGLKVLSFGSGVESQLNQKRDEALPLGESMTLEAQSIGSALDGAIHYHT